MPTRPVAFSELKHAVELWHKALSDGHPTRGRSNGISALRAVHEQLGYSSSSTESTATRLDTAVALGITVREWRAVDPEWADAQRRRYLRYDDEFRAADAAFGRVKQSGPASTSRGARSGRRVADSVPSPSDTSGRQPAPSVRDLANQVVPILRRSPLSLEQVASRMGVSEAIAEAVLEVAHARGASIQERAGLWHLDDKPALGSQRDDAPNRLVSDKDGVLRFATVGDTHLGSKYAREDCLGEFYDEVAGRGISVVLHAGNWIDGEASFNRHDISVHGMDAQMKYLADHYPKRDGVMTWAVAGADHEGWYSRREGVDVGRYAENHMRQAGREDWVDLGYMECFIPLVHGATGKSHQLCLMHPGGGSAYAISYAPQKIVEGFDGGDKPAVLVLGHYHKASYNLIRNVHVIQTGCFQDQTVFMRQLKIASHIAGCFVELKLDPDTGAVVECGTKFRNYFVRDYYRNRWSQHGPVEHATRLP
jgi:hypothetical protein